MNHRFRILPSGLVILTWLLAAQQVAASEFWIITDSRNPVTGQQSAARIIRIDAAQQIEEELAARLPTDPQHAVTEARAFLERGGSTQQQRMLEAYQGVVDAWSLGVTKIPAVVVDKRYVVYGEPSLDKALERIARHRGEQP